MVVAPEVTVASVSQPGGGGRGLRFTAFRPGPHPAPVQAEPQSVDVVVNSSFAISRLVIRSRALPGDAVTLQGRIFNESIHRSRAAYADAVVDNKIRLGWTVLTEASAPGTALHVLPMWDEETEELIEMLAAGVL